MTKMIFLWLLISSVACANYPPTTIRGQSDATPKTKFSFQVPAHQSTDLGGIKSLIETGSSNRLANPGQESSTSSWTASAGSLALESGATNISSGVQSQSWDPAAANDTAASTAFTIPNGFYGKNAEVSCWIKTASVLHKLQVYDGTNVVAASEAITTASSGVFVSVNFVFPGSGTLQPRILAGDGTILYIDDCYMGPARNVGSVELTRTAVIAEGAACAGSPCTITRQSPSNWLTSVTRSAAGTYALNFAAGIFSTAPTCQITTAQETVEFNGAATTTTAGFITRSGGAATDAANMHVTCNPVATQIALPDTQELVWSGYHGTDCNWTYAGAVVDSPDDASCTFTERVNKNFGTVVTYGSSKAGFTFTPKKTGTYYVCAVANASNAGGAVPIDLSDTLGPTTIAEGNQGAAETSRTSQTMCGVYVINSLASRSIRLRSSTNYNLNGLTNVTVDWSIFSLSQSVPAPVLVGSVISDNSASSERLVRFLIDKGAGTCSVTQQAGSSVSCTDGGTGLANVTFAAGTFSSIPNCVATLDTFPSIVTIAVAISSATAMVVHTRDTSGPTYVNVDTQVLCMGPK